MIVVLMLPPSCYCFPCTPLLYLFFLSISPEINGQAEVKCLMQQLLRGMAELHSRWIIHRDLKSSNLLYAHITHITHTSHTHHTHITHTSHTHCTHRVDIHRGLKLFNFLFDIINDPVEIFMVLLSVAVPSTYTIDSRGSCFLFLNLFRPKSRFSPPFRNVAGTIMKAC